MFPYRVQYTESASDIQNYNLFYEIGPTCQNIFELLKNGDISKTKRTNQKLIIFCIMYKFHNSCVVLFVTFGTLKKNNSKLPFFILWYV